MYDAGVCVAVGNVDDPETYRKMRIEQSALVVAASTDEINTNIAFTVHELCESVPIISTSDSPHSVDILEMAGSTRVLQIYDILGRSLAAWSIGGDGGANVISRFDSLIIAEFPVFGTPLIDKTLAESDLRQKFGVDGGGDLEQGHISNPHSAQRDYQDQRSGPSGGRRKPCRIRRSLFLIP